MLRNLPNAGPSGYMAAMTDSFGPFSLDRRRRALTRHGEMLPVSQRGYSLLEALLDAKGEAVDKETLLRHAWPGMIVEESNLSVQVATLRKQLGPEAETILLTVPRFGYRLVVPSPPPAAEPAGGPPLVAVLPFASHGAAADQAWFAEGVADDIIAALSRFKEFAVLSRGSTVALRSAPDPRRAAREMGVRYVLEGSVRRERHRVRVIAQLADAASGTSLWAETFEGMSGDIFAFQDRITAAVAGVVEPEIRKAEIERARAKHPGSLDAYDLFLQAVPLVFGAEPSGYAAAIELLKRAQEIDPSFALIPAYMAWCYEKRGAQSLPPLGVDDRGTCLALARRALTLGGDDPLVQAVCGWVLFIVGGDKTLIATMLKAAEENPNSAVVLVLAASGLLTAGAADEAYRMYLRAFELSPGAPDAYLSLEGLGTTEVVRGNHEAAVRWLQRSLATFNDWVFSYYALIAALGFLGRVDEARGYFDRLLKVAPHARSIAAMVGDSGQNDNVVWERMIPGLQLAGVPER